MDQTDRLLQRYHDGETDRAEQATIASMLAGNPLLAARSRSWEDMHALMTAQAHRRAAGQADGDVSSFAARVMERIPLGTPKVQAKISVAHVVMAVAVVCMVGAVAMLTNSCRLWLPVEGIAAACGLVGLALVVAARPLADLENGLLGRLMAKRMAVGDGEILVCRVLGIAMLIGAAHIMGVWP